MVLKHVLSMVATAVLLALPAGVARADDTGAYTFTVSGGKCSFTLTVSSPSP